LARFLNASNTKGRTIRKAVLLSYFASLKSGFEELAISRCTGRVNQVCLSLHSESRRPPMIPECTPCFVYESPAWILIRSQRGVASSRKTCDPIIRLSRVYRGARGPVIVQCWCAGLPSANVRAVDPARQLIPEKHNDMTVGWHLDRAKGSRRVGFLV
jgi:hypothetical protein